MIFGIAVGPLILRLLRVAVVSGLTYWWNHHSGDTLAHYAAAPTIHTFFKMLRDKYGSWFDWLPV